MTTLEVLMLIAAFLPAIITIISNARNSGKQTQRLDDHDNRLDDHHKRLNQHGEHLQKVDIALVRVEEYQRGLSDGARLTGKNHAPGGAH